jgi:hypothetical protein
MHARLIAVPPVAFSLAAAACSGRCSALARAQTDATSAINAEAVSITRLICGASGGQPESACKQ